MNLSAEYIENARVFGSMRRESNSYLIASVLLALSLSALIAWFAAYVIPVMRVPELDDKHLPDGWRPVAWPFGRDQFGPGIAVECFSAACPQFVRVTVRPKIGFCNCITGVADDDELERIGDVDLIDTTLRPSTVGKAIKVSGFTGRSREYLTDDVTGAVVLHSIAFSSGCDVIVVTATGATSPEMQRDVSDLLESRPLISWVNAALGRRGPS